MKRVTGIGGAFLKAQEPEKLKDWYTRHLGLTFINTSSIFEWGDEKSNNGKGHAEWLRLAALWNFIPSLTLYAPNPNESETQKSKHKIQK
jgi:hypothetical protein